MKSFYSVGLLLVGVLNSGVAFGWGSLNGIEETHQYIDRQAYELLKADPAFLGSGFPSVDKIIAFEGVSNATTGPGPDRDGATLFTEHYYNPRTGEGNGPLTATRRYSEMVEARIAAKTDQLAKAAAWGAHSVADMSVIYHVNGLSRKAAEGIFVDGFANATIDLPEEITGPIDVLNYHTSAEHTTDFKAELTAFFSSNPDNTGSHVDWVDLWYWNGGQDYPSENSSHIHWEGLVFHNMKPAYNRSGYSTAWVNSKQTDFDNGWVGNATVAAALAKGAAETTVANTRAWLGNANEALDRSIQDVYTYWRASISALRPDFEVLGIDVESSSTRARIRGLPSNLAPEVARNVQMRLTVPSCGQLISGSAVQRVGDLETVLSQSPLQRSSPEWEVRLNGDPAKCALKVEIIGLYENTPDLQYHFIEKAVRSAKDAVEGSLEGSFKFSYHAAASNGNSGDFDDGWFGTNSDPVTLLHQGGGSFLFEETVETSQTTMHVGIDPTGTKLQAVSMRAAARDDNSSLSFNFAFREIPLRYYKTFGKTDLTFYGFWAKKEELGRRASEARSSGWSKVSRTDPETGNVTEITITSELKEMFWEQSYIFVAFTNKTEAEIVALVQNGALTGEEFEADFADWKRKVAHAIP